MTDHPTLASVAEKKIPQVSIGMPVYNGEKFIREALDSLLAQTFTDFELIISDNASTDKTEVICNEYSKIDKRIRYVRQVENIGAVANFQFVLSEAKFEYFVWAAADDVRSSDYLEINIEFLSNNLDYAASTSKTKYENEMSYMSMGRKISEEKTRESKLSLFLSKSHGNELFYSVFRSDCIKKNPYVKTDFFGSDWAVVIHFIMNENINSSDQGYVILGNKGLSQSGNIFRHYRKRWIHWFLPMLELDLIIFKEVKRINFIAKSGIFFKLVKLNLMAFKLNLLTECKKFIAGVSL